MKPLRLTLSIISLLVVLGVGTMFAAAEECPKCECVYTQTGEYGLIWNDDCVVEQCIYEIE